jgi:hypothetical protein
MRCIVCHNNVVRLGNFALCTMLHKGFLFTTKSNGITTMKKHLEFEHNTLIKKFCPKKMMWLLYFIIWWASQEVNACDSKCHIWFFFFYKPIQKNKMKTKFVSWRMWCYLWLKVICPWGLLNPCGYREWHKGYV